MPLVEIESEVFAECGAWVNYGHLEDSLSLDELVALYEAAMERQNRLMKTVAAAMGADVSEPDEKPSPGSYKGPKEGGNIGDIVHAGDAAALPIGLGYSTVNKE